MVICNLQRTPLTDKADFQIFAKTDTVMTMLIERLAVPVPPFRLLRRVIVSQPGEGEDVSLRAVDIHNPNQEVGVLRAVDWDGSGLSKRDADMLASIVACRYGGYTWPASNAEVLKPTLHFVGHYGEPPYTLNLNFTKTRRLDMLLSFDPVQGSWERLEPETGLVPSPLLGGQEQADESLPPNWYGRDHRHYCVSSWVDRHGKSEAEAKAIVERKFEESRAEAAAVNYALGGGSSNGQSRKLGGGSPNGRSRSSPNTQSRHVGCGSPNGRSRNPSQSAAYSRWR